MKIQIFASKSSGISYHRLIIPFSYLESNGNTYEILWTGKDESRIACDVLIFNKFLACNTERIKQIKAQGTRIIVDVDDYWHLPPWHINHQYWNQSHMGQQIEDNIRLADIVICTSMKLQDKVRELNKNTVVISNAFPFGYQQYIPDPQPRQKMTFIYAGGSTHLPDVKLLEGKFRRIATDNSIKDNAEFLLAGYDPSKRIHRHENGSSTEEKVHGVWDHMASVFSHTRCSRILGTLPLDNYLSHYDNADVALIPLVANEWNSYKSVLKVMEAASKELPCIVSRVEPYTELEGYPGILWVDKPADWLTHIKWCIKNPIAVKGMGKQLQEKMIENYHLRNWNQVRSQVLSSLVKEAVL